MVSKETFSAAMANRSLRTLRTELEFLSDLSVLSPQQVSSILAQLPEGNDSSPRQLQQPIPAEPVPPAPIQEAIPPPVVPVQHAPVPVAAPVEAPVAAPVPAPAPYLPPTNQFANTTLNEKAPVPSPQQYTPPPAVPPPAYQGPPATSMASAVYEYKASENGDLSFLPHDRIQVLEHMNNDWWRGRNERTGQEGIFPSSYVDVLSNKGPAPPPPSGYGNMPLEVSQSGSAPPGESGEPGKGGKFEQHGKKFGKKMGNAAIFGAGATMGSNIVNSIF